MTYSVAFFSDTHMLPGLHVTLLSLLRSLDAGRAPDVTLHVFLDSVRSREKELIARTHRANAKGSHLEIRDFTPCSPTGGDLLHGNATAYGRLFLAQLLPHVSRCLYLDCDLIVNRNITDIFELFDGRHVLVVDGEHQRAESLDRELFAHAGLDMSGDCFNSGVMGIDLDLWRTSGADARIAEIARAYRGMFRSADQAVLNVAMNNAFRSVGKAFNVHLYPTSPPADLGAKCIYHFVGSPKPWDIMGRLASNHHALWRVFYNQTSIRDRWPGRYASFRRSTHVLKQTVLAVSRRFGHSARVRLTGRGRSRLSC